MMPNGLQATCQGLWVADQATDNLYLLDDDLRPLREVPTVAENSSGLTIGGGFFWIGSNSPAQAVGVQPAGTEPSETPLTASKSGFSVNSSTGGPPT